jgi:hypothetical protein
MAQLHLSSLRAKRKSANALSAIKKVCAINTWSQITRRRAMKENDDINLEGRVFTTWQVLCKSKKLDNRYSEPYWLCQCVTCGEIKNYRTSSLLERKYKSCSCTKKEMYPPKTDCMYYPEDEDSEGCIILTERLCAYKGKCGFYKAGARYVQVEV